MLLTVSCGRAPDAATRFAESLTSVANEMTALHEPNRVVEYHDGSGSSFWIAFIPPRPDPQELAASGLPAGQGCSSPDATILAVGGGERPQCVTLDRFSVAGVRVAQGAPGATVRITLHLDFNGVRLVEMQ